MGKVQTVNLKAKGLYTYSNEFSALPEGALSMAENVEIKRENVIEPRRGFAFLENVMNDIGDRAALLIDFKDTVLAHLNTDKMSYYDSGTGWTDLTGTIAVADSALGRLKTEPFNNSLFMTTSTGIKKMEIPASTPRPAGVPQALDGSAALTGSSGFLADTKRVSYRIVWGYRDANDFVILGAPSNRITIENTAGGAATRNVVLTSTIPDDADATYFFQVYRTGQFATGIEPDDEMQLTYESNPTAGDITAGYVSITDSTPDSLLGATIYTAPSQQGILQQNNPPRFAKVLAQFKQHLFMGNVKTNQRLITTLLSVGTTGATTLAVNDVLTIAGQTYTAKAAENVANREFLLITTGTPAQNIRDTAESLVRVINRNTGNTTIDAYYLSGIDDLPGKVLFEGKPGGASFTASASAHGGAFSPSLVTAYVSTQTVNKNGLAFSKYGEEAFPEINLFLVGDSNEDILQIKASRDSLFIFKTDGIYRLTGYDSTTFRVEQFDATAVILAPDTCVKLNNKIMMLSTQGVVEVSDTGVSVQSYQIEDIFQELFGKILSEVKTASFAIAYETDRKYIIFLPKLSGDAYSRQAYVLNIFTNAWTKWVREAYHGLVMSMDDLVYLSNAGSNTVSKERKAFTYTDFVDESTDTSIESFSGFTVVLASVSGVRVGDLLFQSSSKFGVITAISVPDSSVTVNTGVTWTIGAAEILAAIDCKVTWNQESAQNMAISKHWQEVIMMFKNSFFNSAFIGFHTEISRSTEFIEVEGLGSGSWGQFGWGVGAWGGNVFSQPIRTYVPRDKRRSVWIKVSFKCRSAYSKFLIDGVAFTLSPVSNLVTK